MKRAATTPGALPSASKHPISSSTDTLNVKRRKDSDSEHDSEGEDTVAVNATTTSTSNNPSTNHNNNHQPHHEEEEEDDFDTEQFIEEQHSKILSIIGGLNESELSRYEAGRRTSLNRKEIEKTMQLVFAKNSKGEKFQSKSDKEEKSQPLDEEILVVMGGLAKLYLQELIETARKVANERQSVKIQPRHLREAYRRMKKKGKVPVLPSTSS